MPRRILHKLCRSSAKFCRFFSGPWGRQFGMLCRLMLRIYAASNQNFSHVDSPRPISLQCAVDIELYCVFPLNRASTDDSRISFASKTPGEIECPTMGTIGTYCPWTRFNVKCRTLYGDRLILWWKWKQIGWYKNHLSIHLQRFHFRLFGTHNNFSRLLSFSDVIWISLREYSIAWVEMFVWFLQINFSCFGIFLWENIAWSRSQSDYFIAIAADRSRWVHLQNKIISFYFPFSVRISIRWNFVMADFSVSACLLSLVLRLDCYIKF